MLHAITDDLNRELATLRFAAPVTHVYNPLTYARPAWDQYVQKYGQGQRRVLLLGMNPGPFGMAQVGVPFGEVEGLPVAVQLLGRAGTDAELLALGRTLRR